MQLAPGEISSLGLGLPYKEIELVSGSRAPGETYDRAVCIR